MKKDFFKWTVKGFSWCIFYYLLNLSVSLFWTFLYLFYALITSKEIIVTDEEINVLLTKATGATSSIALIVLGIILVVTVSKNYKKDFKEKINNFKISSSEIFNWLAIGTLLNLFFTFGLNMIPMPNEISNEYNDVIQFILTGSPIVLLISVGIIAPITEEIVFRYLIYERFKNVNLIYAVILSSILFGIMHLNLVQSSYAFLLGCIFCIMNYRHNSLYPSIIMHCAINSSSIISSSYNELSNGALVLFGFIFILIFIASIFKLKENHENLKYVCEFNLKNVKK